MADISDSESLGAWLQGKSPGFACVLAARAALRVAPVLRWALHEEAEDRRRCVVLTNFRALAAASFAGAWPTRAAEIRDAARYAGREAGEAVSEVVNGARMNEFEAKDAIPEMQEYVWRLEGDVRALGVAENAVDATLHAVQAIVDFVDAAKGIASADAAIESSTSAAIAAQNAVDGVNGHSEFFDVSDAGADDEVAVAGHIAEFWQAVEWDRQVLDSDSEGDRDPRKLVARLSGRALWPMGIPVWAGRNWADFKDEMPESEGWRVWTDWYEDRLTGRSGDEAVEFDRVTIAQEDWERGPGHVNGVIRTILEKRRGAANVGRKAKRRRQKPAKRYESPDDPDSYITPSRLRRLGKEKQIPYMVHWFFGMFEDPANETPYNGREGGYQYIWGGPYEAVDELGVEFGEIVSEEALEAAIAEVESDGIVEWAPGPGHPDQKVRMEEAMADDYEPPPTTLEDVHNRLEGGVTPQFGDPMEAESRGSLRNEIALLREWMERDAPVHGGIGHNRPPEQLNLSVELTVEVKQAIEEIDAEVAKSAPNVKSVVESTSRLKKALAWVGEKLNKSVDVFLTKYWSTLAIAAALGTGVALSPVVERVGRVFNAALEWLDAVTLAF